MSKPKNDINIAYTHNMGDHDYIKNISKIINQTKGFSLVEDLKLEPNTIRVTIKKMTVSGMDIRKSAMLVFKSFKKYTKADESGMLIRHIRGNQFRAKYGKERFDMIIEIERDLADLAESCYFSTHDEWAADEAIRGGRESMETFISRG